MSGLGFSTDLFRRFGRAVCLWATDLAGGRALTILEGGYHVGALCDGVEQYLAGLLGATTNPFDPSLKGENPGVSRMGRTTETRSPCT
jgi:acetoin utilization deacetylase AcuC-like enzyme